ncbi:DNA-directed RNA polymerases I, II, and III subunit RPABC3-like isoform X2 [Frieseomelitta varia]|uniref:DNA-directed RNA polymerases I, II, and III subunit RPABC3-like isoform X2 n=1 Tax=Frieseomelitta varia TaxID=561572 RepID=UPI001CB6AB00|nr:DNA-directed RNA polymerases I, II, and III subunit RPABC3-like isoform X2 [Frieseomelitta varia]
MLKVVRLVSVCTTAVHSRNNCVINESRGDKFRLVLATTLREDGYPDVGEWNATEQEGGSRADSFEYVMSGMVYRIEGDEANNEPSSRLAAYESDL